jgi:hypothetical protein
MHLAGQAEGMAALGRLSLDETKLGGMRDPRLSPDCK